MLVALVSAYFRPHVGGVERFTELLASGLSQRGHGVRIVCCRSEPRTPLAERLDGIDVARVPALNPLERRLGVPYPFPEPRALGRALDRALAGADVVHVQDVLYASSIAAIRRARRRAVPVVLTQHVGLVPQRSRALDALQRAAYRATARYARLAAARAAYSPAVAAWAERLWGVDVEVLPVGVAAAEEGERADFGLPRDRFVALFVGRDVAKKRLDVLLAATDPRYEILAVTDSRRAAPPGVRILPFMTPERLGRLMRSADAFVLPSAGEGIPLALQEAMAAGLPVVTTLDPGYAAHFDADDVIAVEPDPGSIRDALVALAESEELRRRLGARSRAVAERHFGVDRFVEAYLELYARAATGGSQSLR